MKEVSLILLAAGDSSRFGAPVKKQWIRVASRPLWQFVADRFASMGIFREIVVTASPTETDYMRLHTSYTVLSGGSDRQSSLQNALEAITAPYVLVSDVARACVPLEIIEELLRRKEEYDVVVPALTVEDTAAYEEKTVDRTQLLRIQTPQLSKTSVLRKALQNSSTTFTDESSAIVAIGAKRGFVKGSEAAKKITFFEDLAQLHCLEEPQNVTFGGVGFDVHAFDDTKSNMHLCGITLDCGYGLQAHSDGDVALHALIDALLGASGLGDIGELFPDTDERYAGIDSRELLRQVHARIVAYGFQVVNVDVTIIAQKPKIAPYKERFRRSIADLLGLEPVRVNVKATTTEKLGFIGRSEGIAVEAFANLTFYNWKRRKENN